MATQGLRRSVPLILALLLGCLGAYAQSAPPSIFFTDITSGPNTGGEVVSGFSGAYVSIYGNNFGSTQGTSTITWNGLNCLRVVSWGQPYLWYQKTVVQLGSSCTPGTGNFTVTVNGAPSTVATVPNFKGGTLTPSQFTVRSTGNIYFIASGGSNAAGGTISAPWATIQHAFDTLANGDIAYVKTLSEAENCAQYNSIDCANNGGGTAALPRAIVAYPGATLTLTTSDVHGIRTGTAQGPYWTIAGMNVTVNGNGEAFTVIGTYGWRLVANTQSCTTGTGTAACLEMEANNTADGYYLYGNVNNQASYVGGSKTYHGFYFSEGDNHTDLGWNDVHNVLGCRGIQFYSSLSNDMYDIHIHDNLIHDTVCDGINLATVSTNNGPIEIYNNLQYNVGKGPTPPDGSAKYNCYNLSNAGSSTTPVLVYNNTCYNAGTSNGGDSTTTGVLETTMPTKLINNLSYQNNGQPYLATTTGCTNISTGSVNNEWYGNGAAPTCSGLSGNLNVNPLVNSTSTPDLHLQSTSPMIGAGSATLFPISDHDGLIRPSPPSIGAYEYSAGGSTVQRPNPPTNLTISVN